MNVVDIVAVVAIVVYVTGRQMLGEPIRTKRLIILPGVLTLIGALNLAKHTVHTSNSDILLSPSASQIAAATGLAQGRVMRVEERGGSLWGQLLRQGL